MTSSQTSSLPRLCLVPLSRRYMGRLRRHQAFFNFPRNPPLQVLPPALLVLVAGGITSRRLRPVAGASTAAMTRLLVQAARNNLLPHPIHSRLREHLDFRLDGGLIEVTQPAAASADVGS